MPAGAEVPAGAWLCNVVHLHCCCQCSFSHSPSHTPCIGFAPPRSDPSKLEALNLNPGVPRVDEQTRREFEQFKAQQAASKGCAALWSLVHWAVWLRMHLMLPQSAQLQNV